MGYLNGKEVFPSELLEQIQLYAQGACVYIPKRGERATRRSRLQERNAEICRKYADGQSVRLLSEEYYLSPQAIYKVLSGKRK